MIDNKGYRKNVGIVLMNNKNQFLIFKRIGADAWQFPQGGIDKNETLERALYRELFEETGLAKKDVIFIGKTKKWITYDLPEKYQKKRNGKLCVGQKQIWFLLKIKEESFKIDFTVNNTPEFDSWMWVESDIPEKKVIYFKKDAYNKALKELKKFI